MSGASRAAPAKRRRQDESWSKPQPARQDGRVDPVLGLQRTAGNRAIAELLRQSSARPLDPGLRAFIAVATTRRAVRRPTPAPIPASLPAPVRRELARPGERLDPSTRAAFEQRLGEDLGQVRVHADPEAGRSAQVLGARAYTVGQRVVFGPGRFAPRTTEGQRLLAHELAHVVQQRRGVAGGVSPTGHPGLEGAAEAAADGILHGRGRGAVDGVAGVGLALAEEKGPTMAEYGQAYPQLVELQDLAETRAQEIMDRAVARKLARWEASEAKRAAAAGPAQATAKPADPEQRRREMEGILRGDLTVAVAFAIDEEGNLHQLVSTSRGRQRKDVDLGPGEWVKPAPKPKGPKAQGSPPAPGTPATGAVPAPAAGQAPPAVAAGHQGAATATADAPQRKRTAEQAFRDAEANIVAFAAARKLQIITTAASSNICPHCAAKLGQAGSTAASPRAKDPEAEVVPANVSPALEAVVRLPPRPPRPSPVVEYRPPRPGPKGPGSGGSGSPPTQAGPGTTPPTTVPPAASGAAQPKPAAARLAKAQPPAPTVEGAGAVDIAEATPTVTAKPAATPRSGRPTGAVPPSAAAAPKLLNVGAAAPAAARAPATVTGQGTTKTSVDLEKLVRTREVAESTAAGRKVQTSTTTLSWGGLGTTTERIEEAGGTGTKTTAGVALGRGEGQLVLTGSKDVAKGVLDEKGNLVAGTETGRKLSGGLVAGPEGIGAVGTAGLQQTRAYGKNFRTTKSIGTNAKVVVRASQVEGSEPPRWRMIVTVSLGATGSLGASAGEQEKATATASASVTAAVTGTFVHTFSAEETRRYLGDLDRNGSRGAEHELRVVDLVARGSLSEARQLLTTLTSTLSAEDAATLAEGEQVSLEVQGGAAGSLGLARGKALSVEGSISASKALKRTVARRQGAVLLTVEVLSETGGGLGASGSSGLVGGGLSAAGKTSAGRSVTFRLDPKAPGYRERFDRILAVDTADQLTALAATVPGLVEGIATSSGWSTTITPKMTIAGAEISISTMHAYAEKVATAAAGTSKVFTGSSGGGVDIGAVGGPKLSFRTEQAVASAVGPGQRATGDVSTTTSQTDFGTSVRALAAGVEKSPIATALGVATGGTRLLQSRTEVTGMKLSDQDYATIAEAAQNSDRWGHAFRGNVNQSYIAWQALARRIAASGGDREEMARALAQYSSKHFRAADAVQAVVRPRGKAEGGLRYDWPAELTTEREAFETIVVGDRLSQLRARARSGAFEEAQAGFVADTATLDKVARAINAKSEQFADAAAVAEMLRRIADVQTSMRAEARSLTAALTPKEPLAPSRPGGRAARARAGPSPAAVPPIPAPSKQSIEDRGARTRSLVEAMLTLRHQEEEVFDTIRNELDHPPWYRGPDIRGVVQALSGLEPVYAQWDILVSELRTVFRERGDNPARADQYGPNRKLKQELRRHPKLAKYG